MAKYLSWLFEKSAPKVMDTEERLLAQRERLLACALQILSDPRAAREITCQALEAALRSPHLGALVERGQEALAFWLDRLLINLILSWLKAHPSSTRLAEPRFARRTTGVAVAQGGRVSLLGEEAFELAQLMRVAQALEVLSPEARVILMLFTAQRRTLREIADLVGCEEESCRFWLNHGRKQLRRVLQKELVDGGEATREPRAVSLSGIFNELHRGKKATARA